MSTEMSIVRCGCTDEEKERADWHAKRGLPCPKPYKVEVIPQEQALAKTAVSPLLMVEVELKRHDARLRDLEMRVAKLERGE